MENENTNMQLLNAPEILDKVMSKYPKEANKGYFYLKGWIIEAMEEYVAQFNQENIAGVWVKASERLPESRLYSDNYCCRYVMIPNEYHTWNFAKIKEMVDAAYEVEWLDEHPQPKQQIGYSEEDCLCAVKIPKNEKERINVLLSTALRFLNEDNLIVLKDALVDRTPKQQISDEAIVSNDFLNEIHPFKDLPDEDKKELIDKVAGECCKILMNIMYSCGIENFIEQMVINESDNKSFVLTFQTEKLFKERFSKAALKH